MHPSYVVLAYHDDSLSYIWKSRGLLQLASRHIFSRRSASLMKEFWTLYFLMMDSKVVMVETIPYSNIDLTHCL